MGTHVRYFRQFCYSLPRRRSEKATAIKPTAVRETVVSSTSKARTIRRTAVRETGVSWHHGGPIESRLKLPVPYSQMASRSFKVALKLSSHQAVRRQTLKTADVSFCRLSKL